MQQVARLAERVLKAASALAGRLQRRRAADHAVLVLRFVRAEAAADGAALGD